VGPAKDCYSERLDQALALAAAAFRDKRRKRTDIPYLSHLLQVMVTVAEHGGTEDQLVAAVLHDYLEDIPGSSAQDLTLRFGPRVAELVVGLSDTTELPKPPWGPRKQAYLTHLARAPVELKLISAADKLHNARSIQRDLHQIGSEVFDRFSASRVQTLWYYRAVVRSLGHDWAHPLLDELRQVVDALHEQAGEPLPGPGELDPMPD